MRKRFQYFLSVVIGIVIRLTDSLLQWMGATEISSAFAQGVFIERHVTLQKPSGNNSLPAIRA